MVPLVLVITQVLKPFRKYYKFHEVIALIIALVGTAAVTLYNMDESTFKALTLLGSIKFIIECVFTAVASWLSASKVYDLSIGKRKAEKEIEEALVESYNKGITEATKITTPVG